MRKKDLVREREHLNGEQKLYKFKNGYGASVVRNSVSYGNKIGLWELAVVTFDENNNFKLCYDTEITDDVIGYLSEKEVDDLLERIEKL